MMVVKNNNDDDNQNIDHDDKADDDTSVVGHHSDEVMATATPDLPVAFLLDNGLAEKEEYAELRDELRPLCEQERDAIRMNMDIELATPEKPLESADQTAQRSNRVMPLLAAVVVTTLFRHISPFHQHSKRSSSFKCFDSSEELQEAVDRFVSENESDRLELNSMYGFPMSTWCVSRVTNFSRLFSAKRTSAMATSFNEPLTSWDTSKVSDMSYMFDGAAAFNQDLSLWNTSAVLDMNSMFHGAKSFNGDISLWDISSVNNLELMFFGASRFNQSLCTWKQKLSHHATVTNMFLDTSCPYDVDPTLENSRFNHLCHLCF